MGKSREIFQCQVANCGCMYDPERGDRRGKVPRGTAFRALSDDWRCPACGAGKKMFKPMAGPGPSGAEDP